MIVYIPRFECRRLPQKDLRATRANRVFCTDEKRIRTENTVIVNTKQAVGVLYKIADCVRMCFSSVRNRRSARTALRPRQIETLQQRERDLGRHA
jgi:hypothetical protein